MDLDCGDPLTSGQWAWLKTCRATFRRVRFHWDDDRTRKLFRDTPAGSFILVNHSRNSTTSAPVEWVRTRFWAYFCSVKIILL